MRKLLLIQLLIVFLIDGYSQNFSFLELDQDIIHIIEGHLEALDTTNTNKKVISKAYNYAMLSNSLTAWRTLGNVYNEGLYVPKDNVIAFECYKRAAIFGDPISQYRLSKLYKNGKKVSQSFDYAFQLSKASAENGFSRGMALTAYMYYKGFGIEQNYKKAFDYACQCANQDHMYGKHLMAYCYEKGTGVKKDLVKAKKIYQELAEYGFKQSIIRLEKLNGERANTLKSKLSEDDILKCPDFIANRINKFQALKVENIEMSHTLKNTWRGQLVFYDWSGTKIEERYPLTMQVEPTGNKIVGRWQWSNKGAITFKGEIKGNVMKFNNLNMVLPGSLGKDEEWEVNQCILFSTQVSDDVWLIGDLLLHNNIINEPFRAVKIVLSKSTSESTVLSTIEVGNDDSRDIISDLNVYPNPFSNKLSVSYFLLNSAEVQLSVCSLAGQKLKAYPRYSKQPGFHEQLIDLSELEPGVYLLRIQVGSSIYVRKIIKK